MTKPRRIDFVMLLRAPLQDELYALPEREFKLLVGLMSEADHRTGLVLGSGRALAELFHMPRKTFMKALEGLHRRGFVEFTDNANQYTPGAIWLPRYGEFIGSAGPVLVPCWSRLAPASGTKDGKARGDKTQDSVPSFSSVPSLDRSQARGRDMNSENRNAEALDG